MFRDLVVVIEQSHEVAPGHFERTVGCRRDVPSYRPEDHSDPGIDLRVMTQDLPDTLIRGCVVCDAELPIGIELLANGIYRSSKVLFPGIADRHDYGNERLVRECPNVSTDGPPVALSDGIIHGYPRAIIVHLHALMPN